MPSTTKTDQNTQADRPVRRPPDARRLAKLLNEWMQDDEAEQRETFEFLRRALDEDRPVGYKLFS